MHGPKNKMLKFTVHSSQFIFIFILYIDASSWLFLRKLQQSYFWTHYAYET